MKVKYSRVLMWLLILSPIMDNINGYLLLSGKTSSISIMFKIMIFLFCFFILLKNAAGVEIVNGFCLAGIFVVQLMVFEILNKGGLVYNISKIPKLLMPMVLILSIYKLLEHDKSVIDGVDKVVRFYCWFFPASLLVTKFLDIGFKTYGNSDVGNKGFYYAGNEIGVIMIMILTLEIGKYKSNRTKMNFINVILGIVSILFIGTKSSYVSMIILILAMLFTEKNRNKKILNIVFVIPVLCGGLWYAIHRLDAVIEIIKMIMWKYDFQSTGIINFLLSDRDRKLLNAMKLGYDKNLFLKLFLGISSDKAENMLNILIEMDLLDLFLQFGLIVFSVIVFFYVKHLKKVIKTHNIIYIIGVILVYGASIVSGHLMFAPMVNIVLAILLLDIELRQNQYLAKNQQRDSWIAIAYKKCSWEGVQ